MTSEAALQALRDTIRVEIIAELVQKLEDWKAQVTEPAGVGDAYRDGIEDAIITIQEG
jgi:hypothetical protein